MSTGSRPLRRDAQRNRDRLVAAAREVFGADGIDASLEEVARRAGVAIGTLYNRVPARVALVEAAFEEAIEESADIARRALEIEDPWEGFVDFVTRTCEAQVVDRGLTEVCARTFPDAPGIEAAKARAGELMLEVVDRAQRSGRLRADFRPGDLGYAMGAVARSADRDTSRWRRHLAFLLDGFRAEAAHPLPD